MLWSRSRSKHEYRRDGWLIKHLRIAKCWVVTYKTRTVPDLTFETSTAAMEWVDQNPMAQTFVSEYLK